MRPNTILGNMHHNFIKMILEKTLEHKRWESFRDAIATHPQVRERELSLTLLLAGVKERDHVLEIGTGSGYLTCPIAKATGPYGRIVTSDVSEEPLQRIIQSPNGIETYLLHTDPYRSKFPIRFTGKFDKIVSLATFHHFDSRAIGSGDIGRKTMLNESHIMLRDEGKLVIADICDDTPTQRYFDSIDDPVHFPPSGHPHDFYTSEQFAQRAKEAGFSEVDFDVVEVPWNFPSEESAKKFIHQIHNAKCSEEESFEIAREMLGFKKKEDHYELGWQLGFLRAQK